jgi:methylmalonyl-CoA mutase C-terminal domain/subunit
MDLTQTGRRPRVLIAKIGLDGHSRGAYVIAHGLRLAGMEVIYTGLRQTPAMVAKTAIQEDVDIIGISSMVGAHLAMVKKLRRELDRQKAGDIPIIIGGIIPEEDYDPLLSSGANKIFPPGTEVREIVQYLHSIIDCSPGKDEREGESLP